MKGVRAWRVTLAMIAACTAMAAEGRAQGLTGQISGTVLDAQLRPAPGAAIRLQNTGTRANREVVTDDRGRFVVTNLLAGEYDLTIVLAGFKTFEQRGVALTAAERVSLPTIVLAVGGRSETVSVTANGAFVQTQSGERSAVVTREWIDNSALRGRDFMGMLRVLPGVVDLAPRDSPGAGSALGMTINGQPSLNYSYDGVTSKDTGTNAGNYVSPALDSIAHVTVQASNMQAEYGRSSGATITVVTKSGSRDFHGSAAFFKRHEKLNANTWERLQQCKAGQATSCVKPRYRFDNTAWTIGGPILIPGTRFNEGRDRFFFFWSQDLLPRTDPGTFSLLTMPTERERLGDFTQTFASNSSNQLRFIRDPQKNLPCSVTTGAGGGCFPGNVIPPNRIDPLGRAILNLFPPPNAEDPSGNRQYNYTYQNSVERPRRDEVVRVDYNRGASTALYSRVQWGQEVSARGESAQNGSAGNGGWPQLFTSYELRTVSTVTTLLHTFNPATVIELTAGVNWARQGVTVVSSESLDRNDATKVLPGWRQVFPPANPLNLIPNMTFGGTNAPAAAASFSIDSKFPFTVKNVIQNYSANITRLRGSHNLKAGVFVELNSRPGLRSSAFNGTINFNGNQANGFDTNLGWANALLGSVNSYTESTVHPFADGRYRQVEFFVQDNWRVRPHLTVDAGIRAYYLGPTFVTGQRVSAFDPARYDAARAVTLYQPLCPGGAASCTSTTRIARNPLTGQLLNNTFIGKPVPGSGDLTNGMVVLDKTPYDGVLRPAPRVGIAWDVTGDGRTALRGGAGIFYDRYADEIVLGLVDAPPLLETRTANFTTLSTLLSTPDLAPGVNPGVSAFTTRFKPPTVYTWSAGIQREIGWSLLADVAYVGNASRNIAGTVALNGLPYGTTRIDLNPQNADPTNGGASRAIDYLRPRVGYGGISDRVWSGRADYHSIQMSVTRRLSNGFGAGISYTGSIRRSISSPNPFLAAVGVSDEARNYTASGSRPHNLVFYYTYVVPGLGRVWPNAVVRALSDGWQVSGVTTAQGGMRGGFTYNFTPQPAEMTGGPGDSRVVLVCDPNLPRGERTTERQFRTECVQAPGPMTLAGDIYYLGSALGDEYRQNGYVNHDLALFKNFELPHRAKLQIRVEAYNVFNTNQFTGVDTSAQFSFTTREQTDTNFGRVTGTRPNSSRVIQLGARFTF